MAKKESKEVMHPKVMRPAPTWQDCYYRRLEGATILLFYRGSANNDEGSFPKFAVKLRDGEMLDIEISADEEGNHGGFIFGLPYDQTD